MQLKLHKPEFNLLSNKQLLLIAIAIIITLTTYGYWQTHRVASVQDQLNTLVQNQQQNLDIATIASLEQLANKEQISQLQQQLLQATDSSKLQNYTKINELYSHYKNKLQRNKDASLDIAEFEKQTTSISTALLEQNLSESIKILEDTNKNLDAQWSTYQASLIKKPTQTPPPISNANQPSSAATSTISTSRGSFNISLLKYPLSQVRVKTVSASDDNCQDKTCAAKPLADYVKQHGGFAGMNGTYFCPPDYSGCAGQHYGYNFPIYNTPTGRWLNYPTLAWNNRGLATFNGQTPKFYLESKLFSGGSVTAAIANSPTLLVHNGNITASGLEQPMHNKGYRGSLGVGGGNIYLVVIRNASVIDAAHVMKALGVTDAINLDGGGSSALYENGRYLVGPGRLLPNAIVLTR